MERFGYTDDELRPYFSQEKVLNGMFSLVGKIFGVTVAAADGEARVTWKAQKSRRIDSKRLRAERPNIADDYTNETTTRVLRVKKGAK